MDCGQGQDITRLPRVSKIHDVRLLNLASSGADIMKQINIQLKVEITAKGSGEEFKVREVST